MKGNEGEGDLEAKVNNIGPGVAIATVRYGVVICTSADFTNLIWSIFAKEHSGEPAVVVGHAPNLGCSC